MKKAFALLVSLAAFGGTLASAEAEEGGSTPASVQSTAAVMPLTATVSNVCTYAAYDSNPTTSPPVTPLPVGAPYNQIDVNGKTYTQPAENLGTYKANVLKDGGTHNLYIHRCTSFTMFTPEYIKGVVSLTSQAADNSSHALKYLNVDWKLDTDGSADDLDGVGDVHYGNVTFTIPAGQWNAAAGQYSGELKLFISYQ